MNSFKIGLLNFLWKKKKGLVLQLGMYKLNCPEQI